MAVENIVRKREIACNKQFLLLSQCFLSHMVLIFHFKCILKCHLQFVSIWTSLKFCHLVLDIFFLFYLGTPPSLHTITPAALLDDFSTYSHSVSRPSSLPLGHSGKPSFCDIDGESICTRENLEQHCNNKRQNGFDDRETESCSSREKSHVKCNSVSGGILVETAAVKEERQSRRSSRSSTPSVTPVKMEMLTPSCTPCSTPNKSPSPSRNDFKAQKRNKRKNYLFAKYDDVLARWHDGLFYLGKILKVENICTSNLFLKQALVLMCLHYKSFENTWKRRN